MDDPCDPDQDSAANTMARRWTRRWARRIECCCCTCATYFPLFFVYGITTWAVWVLVSIESGPSRAGWGGTISSLVGIVLYGMLNWSYTTAVFTDPGSTIGGYKLANRGGYSALPTQANPDMTSFTVKSNGETRFCKKCHAPKPDRAHHCSTCRRCVLKMDHHCPWLATCIGLRNHKAFLLFLMYTTIFCLYCLAVSGSWTWVEILGSTTGSYKTDNFMPVNYVILCVVSGIIGLVVGAFTGWHILLASRGQTTIECLEKTRYLSPLRKHLRASFAANHSRDPGTAGYGQQLLDMHSNALPGITRPEEGEDYRYETPPPAAFTGRQPAPSTGPGYAAPSATTASGFVQALMEDSAVLEAMTGNRPATADTQLSYADFERFRAWKRHEAYRDEQDSSELPHAFDLGAKRNLAHLFGGKWYLWAIPICNTTGDGWSWEPSRKWLEVRDRLAREREEQRSRERAAGWGEPDSSDWAATVSQPPPLSQGAGRFYDAENQERSRGPYSEHGTSTSLGEPKLPSKADRVLGRDPNLHADTIRHVSSSSHHTKNDGAKGSNDLSLKRLCAKELALVEVSDDDAANYDDNGDAPDEFMDEAEESLGKLGNGRADSGANGTGRARSAGAIRAADGKLIPTTSAMKGALVLQPGIGGGSGGVASGASGLLTTKGAGSSSPSISEASSPRLPAIGMGVAGGETKGSRNGGQSHKVNGKAPTILRAARTSEDDVD